MGILKNLFGKKSDRDAPSKLQPSSSDPGRDPNQIRVFDKLGRELFISKEQWRKDVLPGSMRSNWDKPDELYNIMVMALKDGFAKDLLEPSKRLYEIDPDRVRASCLRSIVLIENQRPDDAEKTLNVYLGKHGANGIVLTNLAKAHAAQNRHKESEEVLWRALMIDPNQENGLGWYTAIQRERDGEAAGLEALRRVAAFPNSWRAQLWLARAALQSGNLQQALSLYDESITRAGNPVPSDLLMQLSGDLGNQGQLIHLLRLVEPRFDPIQHGLLVGNNLIKSHVDLGNLSRAREIVNALYSLARPDWKETLSYWDNEIARKEISNKPPVSSPEIGLLSLETPLWLKDDSPTETLFPRLERKGPILVFLGCTAEKENAGNDITVQLSDAPGRLSRAVPVFLAEVTHFQTNSRVQTLMPWITNNGGGFLLSGHPWSNDDASKFARQLDANCNFVVVTHLKTQSEPWTIELRILNAATATSISELVASFPQSMPSTALRDMAHRFLDLLLSKTSATRMPKPGHSDPPQGDRLIDYLIRQEQLLAVRCASMEPQYYQFLSSARDIVDGNIQLCASDPANVPSRLVLAFTLRSLSKVDPEVVREFQSRVDELQKQSPLPGPAQQVVQALLKEV